MKLNSKAVAIIIVASIITAGVCVVKVATPAASQSPAVNAVTGNRDSKVVYASSAVAGNPFTIYGVCWGTDAANTQQPDSGITITLHTPTMNIGTPLGPAITTSVSGTDGTYQLTTTENTPGTYRYWVWVHTEGLPGGSDGQKTELQITVIPSTGGSSTPKTPTTLHVSSPADYKINVRANTQFSVTGWLTSDTALSGQTLLLQKWDGTKWATVKSGQTDNQGMATMTDTLSTKGTYQYRVYFEGSTSLAPSASELVKVTVK